MINTVGSYRYSSLAGGTTFRILELLPGKEDDIVSVILHPSDLRNHREYEAISYTWGDINSKAAFLCDGKVVEATTNLHASLCHLRLDNESRFLWADALWLVKSRSRSDGVSVGCTNPSLLLVSTKMTLPSVVTKSSRWPGSTRKQRQCLYG
jgi:hypothetical protein